MRRDIRYLKLSGILCVVAALVCIVTCFHFESLSRGFKGEYWKMQAFAVSLFAFLLAGGFRGVFLVCLGQQRQAEYMLYLKELIETRDKERVADPWR
jgi:hypothetical protein